MTARPRALPCPHERLRRSMRRGLERARARPQTPEQRFVVEQLREWLGELEAKAECDCLVLLVA